MSRRLPLFPLSVVLFPGASVPLHVFEPRYRRLLADSQAADRRFGIVPHEEEREAPAPGAVGCVAEVRAVQELPDGRSNILIHGERRFKLVRYLDEDTPYYLGVAEEFDDDAGTTPPPAEVAALRAQYTRYLDLLRTLVDTAPENEELPADAAALSFHVAAALEIDATAKQRLLEFRSTAERVAALLRVLPPVIAAVERAVQIRRRAHTNGKGGRRPDIATG